MAAAKEGDLLDEKDDVAMTAAVAASLESLGAFA